MKNKSQRPVGTLKSVLLAMRSEPGPVVRTLVDHGKCSVIAVGLKGGEALPDFAAKAKTRVTVLTGCLIYRDQHTTQPLFAFDTREIPVGTVHALTATRKSICLLFGGSEA